MASDGRRAAGPWAREVHDAVRGVSGGLLFGIPLLYTMEVWWVGTHTTPVQLQLVLALTFALVFVMNLTGGFRGRERLSVTSVFIDTVEAMALALLSAAGVLFVLGRIGPATPLDASLGKVVYEALPFAMGVAFARHYLRGDRNPRGGHAEGGVASSLQQTVSDLGATAVGAAFIASSIAPTDEIPMVTAGIGPVRTLLVASTSLVVSYVIVFAAGFTAAEQRRRHPGILQRPLTETAVSYVVSLLVAAVMLIVFQNVRLGDPLAPSLAQVIVLGLPATVGGAAGRLAV